MQRLRGVPWSAIWWVNAISISFEEISYTFTQSYTTKIQNHHGLKGLCGYYLAKKSHGIHPLLPFPDFKMKKFPIYGLCGSADQSPGFDFLTLFHWNRGKICIYCSIWITMINNNHWIITGEPMNKWNYTCCGTHCRTTCLTSNIQTRIVHNGIGHWIFILTKSSQYSLCRWWPSESTGKWSRKRFHTCIVIASLHCALCDAMWLFGLCFLFGNYIACFFGSFTKTFFLLRMRWFFGRRFFFFLDLEAIL